MNAGPGIVTVFHLSGEMGAHQILAALCAICSIAWSVLDCNLCVRVVFASSQMLVQG
jgi:hypothetical protein